MEDFFKKEKEKESCMHLFTSIISSRCAEEEALTKEEGTDNRSLKHNIGVYSLSIIKIYIKIIRKP